jgi:hypothetical protein
MTDNSIHAAEFHDMWRWIVTKDYCGSKLFEHPSPDGDGARGLTVQNLYLASTNCFGGV